MAKIEANNQSNKNYEGKNNVLIRRFVNLDGCLGDFLDSWNKMTEEEKKEVERVCGLKYEYSDIPAVWRQRDRKEMLDKGLATEEELDRLDSREWAMLHGAYQNVEGEWIV